MTPRGSSRFVCFLFQAEDGIRDIGVTGVQACALPIYRLRVQQVESRFAAVLAERNRIAREIHDNLAQEMLGISVQLELVTRLMAVSTEKAKTDRKSVV